MSRSADWIEAYARLLLRLYPAAFRRRHGEACVEAARHRLERERSAGKRAVAALLITVRVLGVDALVAATSEWRRHGAGVVLDARHGGTGPGVARLIAGFASDVRVGLRSLARRPFFAVLVVGTLGLGIGASAAVFGALDRIVLRPLPYANSDRLVLLALEIRERGWQFSVPEAAIERWREGARTVEAIETYRTLTGVVSDGGEARMARIIGVSPGLPSMLGVRALSGRVPGAPSGSDEPVLLVTERYWRGELGSDPAVLGRLIPLNDTLFTVAGVWPEAARLGYGAAPDFVRVLPADQESPRGDFTMVLALMKPGVTPDLLESELAPLLDGVEDISPSMVPLVNPLWGLLGDDYVRGLWLVFGGGIVLMVVAVLTATNLMLGRADARVSEIAMRIALGASRARLALLFLAESSVLSAAGMAVALAVALAAGAGMRMIEPGSLVPPDTTGLAGRALAFAATLSVLTAVVCAIVPLLLVKRSATLGGRSSGGRMTERPSRFRSVVVATQAALAVVLVAGASLMARSLLSMTRVDTGMAIDRLLIASIRLPEDRYSTEASRVGWQERATATLARLPGVAGVTTSSAPPLSFSVRGGMPFLDGEPEPVLTGAEFVSSASAPPGYFEVLGIPILQGRAPRDGDTREVVVSQSFARTRQAGVLGRSLRFPGDTIAWTVVGVVGDIRAHGLTDSPDRVQLYFPDSPGSAWIRFVLRTEGDPAAVLPSVRSAIQRLDPSLPLRQATTGSRIVREQTARVRFVAALLGGFACLGLIFATGAVYGMTSIETGRRVREVGLRIALGATTGSVVRRVAFTGLVPIAAGGAIGTFGVLWASPLLDALLFRIDARDPSSIAAALAVLLAGGIVGCSVPAWRASRTDPAVALRAD